MALFGCTASVKEGKEYETGEECFAHQEKTIGEATCKRSLRRFRFKPVDPSVEGMNEGKKRNGNDDFLLLIIQGGNHIRKDAAG